MATSFFNQYMYYNDVTVILFGDNDTLDKEYIISKVNTCSLPPKDSGAHLISLSITPPKVNNQQRSESGVKLNYGASGSLSVVDYKNSLFKRLVDHTKAIKPNSGISVTPRIHIIVKCYTGIEEYAGFVNEYKFTFNGGAPTITMEWSAIESTKSIAAIPPFGLYYNIDKFFEMAENTFCKDSSKFITPVFIDGDNRYEGGLNIAKSNKLRFSQDSTDLQPRPCANFDLRSLGGSTSNMLLNSYMWFTKNAVTVGENIEVTDSDGTKQIQNERKNLIGYLSKDAKEFIIETRKVDYTEPSQKSESTEACSEIVFVQNGRFAPYKRAKINIEGKEQYRVVIPMESISFETNLENLSVQTDILNSTNYSTTVINGKSESSGVESNSASDAQGESDSKQTSSTKITFDCYNVMSFDLNNSSTQVAFIVYDEYGEIHPISGTGCVQEVSYDISGAVVKASVTVTKELSSSSVEYVKAITIESEDNTDNNK